MMKLSPFSDHRPRILLTAACAAALVLGAYSLPDRAGVPAVTGEEDASLELVSSHETGTADYVAERDNGLQQVTIKNPAPKKDAREGELLLDPAAESVANYINRSYRIPLKQARRITSLAVDIGEKKDIDPLLILSVIATESSFNPNARSGAGAEGLMQVMTKIHSDKFERFGGEKAAFEIRPNMLVGTEILSDLIRRTGSVRRALKWYSGAANLSHDNGYGANVMRERSRMMVAASGDSNAAVQLSRSRQAAPNVNTAAEGRQARLSYARWVSLTGGDETASARPIESASSGDAPRVTSL